MRVSTLPRYLVGSRQAILDVASSPFAIPVGVLFVISAGLAREYDGEDLVHEPWHLLGPLGASFVAGSILFLLVHGSALARCKRGGRTPPPLHWAYLSFMGLFWMTAPMAWLYAIPYERFMSPADAVTANLWTLTFVAVWRVLLITRVISVVYGIGAVASFFMVMLFADTVLFTAVSLVPSPVIDIMGGFRHSERDAIVATTLFWLLVLSVLTAPVWIIGALAGIKGLKPTWDGFTPSQPSRRHRGLLIAAALSLLAWVPMLFLAQPEQVNRRTAERLLRSGRVAEGLAIVSLREARDYPPHWDPPPRLGYGETGPGLDVVMSAIRAEWPKGWIAELYLQKIRRRLQQQLIPFGSEMNWVEIVAHLETYSDIAEHHGNAAFISFLLDFDGTLSEEDRVALGRLQEFAVTADASPE